MTSRATHRKPILGAIDTASAEHGGRPVRVAKIGVDPRPVVQHEDVSHQQTTADGKDEEPADAFDGESAHGEDRPEQRGTLQDEDLLESNARQQAQQLWRRSATACAGSRWSSRITSDHPHSHRFLERGEATQDARSRHTAAARGHTRSPLTNRTAGPWR